MLTFQVEAGRVKEVLRYLKHEAAPRFQRLDDLTAVDESARRERGGYPDFTLVYHLLSFDPPTPGAPEGAACTARSPARPASPTSGPRPTGTSAKSSTHGRPLRGPPEPAAHHHARRLGGPPPAKEPSRPGDRDGPLHAGRCAEAPAGGRRRLREGAGRRAPPGAQHRAAPRQHPRPAPLHPRAGRRGDHRDGPRHRLPPPGGGKDRRAPDLAPVHPLHGPRGLPGGGRQQPAVRPGRRNPGGHQGPGAGPDDPGPAERALPAEQPPGLVLHLRPRRRRHEPDLLRLPRARDECSTSSSSSPAAGCTRPGSASAVWRRTCPKAGRRRWTISSRFSPRAWTNTRRSPARTPSSRRAPRASAASRWRMPSTGASPDRTCAPAAWSGTCARSSPTRATRISISMSPPRPPATATRATSCAWRKCARASGSSSRRRPTCRPAAPSPTITAT